MMQINSYDGFLAAAIAASKAGDSAGAVRDYLQAHASRPEAMEPVFLLAAEYASLGEIDKAEEAFALAVVRAPGFHLARFQLGLLQLTHARPALANLTWESLLDGVGYWSPLTRGYLHAHDGRLPEALKELRSAEALIGDNAPLLSDVRETIRRLESNAEQADVKPSEEADVASQHVLLSGYLSQSH